MSSLCLTLHLNEEKDRFTGIVVVNNKHPQLYFLFRYIQFSDFKTPEKTTFNIKSRISAVTSPRSSQESHISSLQCVESNGCVGCNEHPCCSTGVEK